MSAQFKNVYIIVKRLSATNRQIDKRTERKTNIKRILLFY